MDSIFILPLYAKIDFSKHYCRRSSPFKSNLLMIFLQWSEPIERSPTQRRPNVIRCQCHHVSRVELHNQLVIYLHFNQPTLLILLLIITFSAMSMTQIQTSSRIPQQVSSQDFSRPATEQIVERNYNSAARLFLNKKFLQSWNLLSPTLESAPLYYSAGDLSNKTWLKVWSLYFALLDVAAKHSITPNSDKELSKKKSNESLHKSPILDPTSPDLWSRSDRMALVGEITTSQLWDKLSDVCGGLAYVHPEIAVSITLLELRYCSDTNTLSKDNLEKYLSAIEVFNLEEKALISYNKLLELYILHVLPRFKLWHEAIEFVTISPFIDNIKKERLVTAINNLQAQQEEKEQSEKIQREIEQKQLDDAKKVEEMAQAERARQRETYEEQLKQRELARNSFESTRVDDTTYDSSSGFETDFPNTRGRGGAKKFDHNQQETSPSKPVIRGPATASPHNPIIRIFRYLLEVVGIIRGKGVSRFSVFIKRLGILSFLVSFIMFRKNPQFRQIIQKYKGNLIEPIKRTTSMAFRVTYL